MTQPTPFELCKNLQRILLTRAAEVASYQSWGDDFAVQRIRSTHADVSTYSWYRPVNPNELTRNEMRELGFSIWSEEDPMMLIPLWLMPYLSAEFKGGCINGERGTLELKNLDNDHRGGCLAYGAFSADSMEMRAG